MRRGKCATLRPPRASHRRSRAASTIFGRGIDSIVPVEIADLTPRALSSERVTRWTGERSKGSFSALDAV